MKKRQRQWMAWLLISVLVHLGLLIQMVQYLNAPPDIEAGQRPPFEIELVPPPESALQQQIVAFEKENQQKEDASKVDRRFLAKHHHTVQKETLAKPSLEKADIARPLQREQVAQMPSVMPRGNSQNLAMLFPEKLFQKAVREPTDSRVTQSQKAASGGSVDFIEKIEIGSETLLNTDEFRFYGYFSRMRETVRQYWVSNLDDAVYRSYVLGSPMEGGDSHETKVVMVLRNSGTIEDVKIVKSCGNRELDQATVNAFLESGAFPNPPKDLFESKEHISITWSFLVKVS